MRRISPCLPGVLLGLMLACGQAAGSEGGSAALAASASETQLEQDQALAADAMPRRGPVVPPTTRLPSAKGVASNSEFRLFAGLDDAALDAIRMNPSTNAVLTAFTGVQVWGAAWDNAGQRVLFNSGADLYVWIPGAAPSLLGTIVDAGDLTLSFVSLAWHEGVLYGTRNIATEAIYRINVDTLVATPQIVYESGYDIGGLAVDAGTGVFYGTNDATHGVGRGLVSIATNGTVSLVAPYPDGYTDIDGLAIGDGRAYLVTDDAADEWPVFDFGSMSYVAPLLSPFGSSETFSGAAWIRDPFRLTLSEGHGWEAAGAYYTRFRNPRVLHEIQPLDTGIFWRAGERIGDLVYMLDASGNAGEFDAGTGELLRDIATGAPSTGGFWTGMARDPGTGLVYVSSADGSNSALHSWNPATGAASLIGTITNAETVLAIAVDGSGAMWGVDTIGATLLSINKSNAFGTPVGPLGYAADVGAGLGWDAADDTLYASLFSATLSRGELRRVDRATGASFPVAVQGAEVSGNPSALFWLAFGPPLTGIFADGFEAADD